MGSAWPALVKYLILMAVLLIQGGFGQTTTNPTVIPTTATTTPEPPLDVHVTVSETTVELTWRDEAACNESVYNVTYATNSSGAASDSHGGTVSSTCVTPSDLQQYRAHLTNLIPGAGYTVIIWRQTSVRWNNNTQTIPAAVENLTLENHDTTTNLTVNFTSATGDVTHYVVELVDTTNGSVVKSRNLSKDITEDTLHDLVPGRNYKVIVTTVSGDCNNTEAAAEMCTVPAAVENLTLENKGTTNSLTVNFTKAKGDVTNYTVELMDTTNESVVRSENLSNGTTNHLFTDLDACKIYEVHIKTLSGELYSKEVTETACTGKSYGDPNLVRNLNLTTDLNKSLSVGFDKASGNVDNYTVLLTNGNPSLDLIEHLNPDKTECSFEKLQPCTKYHVSVTTFPEYYKKREADSGYLFSEEYQELSSVGKSQAMEAATLAENRTKNRYTNILPFDVTRVKLASVEDIPHSDYINANYIKGHSSSREYIAAQGPLAGTREDFWRMVWEQKVNQIVMLTNCVERGQPKCECYWPMDITPVRYGDIGLVMEWDKPSPEWTIRHLLVKNHKTDEMRPLYHFHFTAWPDHGVPDTTDSLTNFVRIFRTHVNTTNKGGPIVVHCSAGVGRTGTFISLDHLLQDIDKKPEIDIYGIVHNMRMSRVLMVQTEMQYIFIHKCILKVLEEDKKKDSDYEVIYSNEGIYENNIVDNFHMEPRNQNNNENH
ncbi:unnamed protein product [Lampetra fluviatilis]